MYFIAASVKCYVAAVKRLPLLHHSADYIFISFGNTESILLTLKIEYRFIWGDLIKPSLRFSFSYVFIVSKGNILDFEFIP